MNGPAPDALSAGVWHVLERALRDSHTAAQHILVGWSMETAGGVLLGAEPGMLEL